MEFLNLFSILQLYWVLQGLYYFALTILSFVSGRYWKKAHHLSSFGGPLLWWQFNKRVTLFYLVGFFTTLYLLVAILKSTYLGWAPFSWVLWFVDALTLPSQANVDTTSCLVGCLIYFCHVTCRLYQCTFICIHSWRQVLGPFWVLVCYLNQVFTVISVIAEGPKLDGQYLETFSFTKLRIHHLIGVSMFVLASYIQFSTFYYLTSLRKNKAGHVVTTSYKIPKNSLFESLNTSSPHYFAEVLAHLSILVAMGTQCHTWMAVTYYVACHMTYLAYVTHQYYLDKFGDEYPKNRNILIPYLF